MAQHLRLFGFILVVPLIGLAVAAAIDTRSNSELRRVVRAQNPSMSADEVSQLTVAGLCERTVALTSDVCGFNRHIRLLGVFSAAAALTGLSLVALIWMAGVAARRSRQLLLRIFKPGLYVTACVLIGLVVGHAAIAIAVVYYAEGTLINATIPPSSWALLSVHYRGRRRLRRAPSGSCEAPRHVCLDDRSDARTRPISGQVSRPVPAG